MNRSAVASVVVQSWILSELNGRPAGQLSSFTWANQLRNAPGSGRCQHICGQSPGPGARLGPGHFSWGSGKQWPPGASSHLRCNMGQWVRKHTQAASQCRKRETGCDGTDPVVPGRCPSCRRCPRWTLVCCRFPVEQEEHEKWLLWGDTRRRWVCAHSRNINLP